MSAAQWSAIERSISDDIYPLNLSPNAERLYYHLRTSRSQTVFPGLFVLTTSYAASRLRLTVDEILDALVELGSHGVARFDPITCVVWLPALPGKIASMGAISDRYAKGWRRAIDGLPDCELVRLAYANALRVLVGKAPRGYESSNPAVKAFCETPPPWQSEEPPEPPPRSGRDQENREHEYPTSNPIEYPTRYKDTEKETKTKPHPDPHAHDPREGSPAAAPVADVAPLAPSGATAEPEPKRETEPRAEVGGLFESLRKVPSRWLRQGDRSVWLARELEAVVVEAGAPIDVALKAIVSAAEELERESRVLSPSKLLVVIFRRHVTAAYLNSKQVDDDMVQAARERRLRDAANSAPDRLDGAAKRALPSIVATLSPSKPVFGAPRSQAPKTPPEDSKPESPPPSAAPPARAPVSVSVPVPVPVNTRPPSVNVPPARVNNSPPTVNTAPSPPRVARAGPRMPLGPTPLGNLVAALAAESERAA